MSRSINVDQLVKLFSAQTINLNVVGPDVGISVAAAIVARHTRRSGVASIFPAGQCVISKSKSWRF
jgi:hypothetical protein